MRSIARLGFVFDMGASPRWALWIVTSISYDRVRVGPCIWAIWEEEDGRYGNFSRENSGISVWTDCLSLQPLLCRILSGSDTEGVLDWDVSDLRCGLRGARTANMFIWNMNVESPRWGMHNSQLFVLTYLKSGRVLSRPRDSNFFNFGPRQRHQKDVVTPRDSLELL